MANQVNAAGKAHATELIDQGNIDSESPWEFTADDGNALLGDPTDWTEYAKWFLGRRGDEDNSEVKNAWMYPFGKQGKIFRGALVAIASRAGAEQDQEISDLATTLREALDAKLDAGKQVKQSWFPGGLIKRLFWLNR